MTVNVKLASLLLRHPCTCRYYFKDPTTKVHQQAKELQKRNEVNTTNSMKTRMSLRGSEFSAVYYQIPFNFKNTYAVE